MVMLLVDIFGPTPTIKDQRSRIRTIGVLQSLYPDLFENFLTTRIATLKDADIINEGSPVIK